MHWLASPLPHSLILQVLGLPWVPCLLPPPVLAVLGAWLSYVSASTPARFARVLPGPEGSTRDHLKGRLTFDSCWPFPSCRSVEMKGVKAFVACLVLALLAGRASARRCVIQTGAASFCSYYSDALGTQLELTQACVSANDALDPTNKYHPPFQPWWGVPKATVNAFIKEVGKSCDFGTPNHAGVNRSPYACFKLESNGCTGNCLYSCRGVTKRNKDKSGWTCCGAQGSQKCWEKACSALLSALN
jgi:hypothetical protein